MQGQVRKSRQSLKNRVNVFIFNKKDNLLISIIFIRFPLFLIVHIHWDFLLVNLLRTQENYWHSITNM